MPIEVAWHNLSSEISNNYCTESQIPLFYFFFTFSKDFQEYRNFREGDRGERHQVSTLHLFYGERSKKLDRFTIKQHISLFVKRPNILEQTSLQKMVYLIQLRHLSKLQHLQSRHLRLLSGLVLLGILSSICRKIRQNCPM
jgi:hypothetical protein